MRGSGRRWARGTSCCTCSPVPTYGAEHVGGPMSRTVDRDVRDERPVVAVSQVDYRPPSLPRIMCAISRGHPQVVVVHVHAGVVTRLPAQPWRSFAGVVWSMHEPATSTRLVVRGLHGKLAVVHGSLVELVDPRPRFTTIGDLKFAFVSSTTVMTTAVAARHRRGRTAIRPQANLCQLPPGYRPVVFVDCRCRAAPMNRAPAAGAGYIAG